MLQLPAYIEKLRKDTRYSKRKTEWHIFVNSY